MVIAEADTEIAKHTHAIAKFESGRNCGLWIRGVLGGCRWLLRMAKAKNPALDSPGPVPSRSDLA